MKSTMYHLILPVLGGLFILYVGYMIWSVFAPSKNVTVASFSCNGGEMRLVHRYENSLGRGKFQYIYFEFTKGELSIRTWSTGNPYGNGGLMPFPVYAAPQVPFKVFKGFTWDYENERAWNILMEKEIPDADFKAFASCLDDHSQEINKSLSGISPTKDTIWPLTINSVTNTSQDKLNYAQGRLDFSCTTSNNDSSRYSVSMQNQGRVYQPHIEAFGTGANEFNVAAKKFPQGYWLVTMPSGSSPSIGGAAGCKNSYGETLGSYIDGFKKIAPELKVP